MRRQAFGIFGLAFVAAGLAVVVARNWLSPPQAAAMAEPPVMASIVVARLPLPMGQHLSAEMLREMPWPPEAVPAGSFHAIAEMLSGPEPRIALRPVEAGEPVLRAKISGFGARSSLSAQLAEGKRAVAIRVNEVVGVAGFIQPGDRVDLLLTREAEQPGGAGHGASTTDIILQNLRVLGIDQSVDETAEKPSVAHTATLEVSPDEAQKVALAAQIGTLALALRNGASDAATKPHTLRVADLTDRPAVHHAAGGSGITVYRGLERSVHAVPR